MAFIILLLVIQYCLCVYLILKKIKKELDFYDKHIYKVLELYLKMRCATYHSSKGENKAEPNVAIRIAVVPIEGEQTSFRTVVVIASTIHPWIARIHRSNF